MKTTKRLTAITLVLLLLLSLCGCMAEEPIEEISRPETTRTTPATTLSTAPTTAATVTITDTTVVTTDATATQTATQTATTVVTTQVTTKVTVTVTDPTAAPTTAAPQKPAIEWTVIKGELPEGGITPGAEFLSEKDAVYRLDYALIKEQDKHYGEIIESAAELDALAWNDPQYVDGRETNYQKPTYTDDFFEESVLIEFTFSSPEHSLYFTTESTTFDNGTLHLHFAILEFGGDFSMLSGVNIRVLVEMTREDAAKVRELVVYQSNREMTAADRKHFWGVDW